ncbi:hypothetical protein GMAR_ORF190 [Golden Marseillevirus]|uniref:hypothetical protein n=1 Tax=Golden Marseillevirus TaxID=1720526 RepID=UPI000877AA32|nr:hypothetical protein GMAR_ORF190 [Golden Marseillevirus]ALX27564.1 hypothetical protein GMAR_ORF190 [Golden Marseillevirus]
MNKWSLLVVSEDSKLCVTKNRGKENILFHHSGKLCDPPAKFVCYILLWRHMFPKD